MAQINVIESWRLATLSDVTADNSNKSWTVPASTEYQVFSIYVTLVTGAGAARQLVVEILDASGTVVIHEFVPALTQAASLTYRYQFGSSDMAALRDTNYLGVVMPVLGLAAGEKVRVRDKNAVAAGADDMSVWLKIASRSVA